MRLEDNEGEKFWCHSFRVQAFSVVYWIVFKFIIQFEVISKEIVMAVFFLETIRLEFVILKTKTC